MLLLLVALVADSTARGKMIAVDWLNFKFTKMVGDW